MHRDIMGVYINVDDSIAYAKSNHLHRGLVIGVTPKMLRIVRVGSTYDQLIFPSDCIVIDRSA
jgi:hypothetical protein